MARLLYGKGLLLLSGGLIIYGILHVKAFVEYLIMYLCAIMEYWRGEALGRSDPQAWRKTVEVMMAADLLKEPVDSDQAFSNDFLP